MARSKLSEAEMHMAARTVRNEWGRMQRRCPHGTMDDRILVCTHEDNPIWTQDCQFESCPFITAINQEKVDA